jgi:tellurite resistance protein TerC
MVDRFQHLSVGLAVILALVGLKMCVAEWIHIPIWISLVVIGLILAGCILSSLWATRPSKGRS